MKNKILIAFFSASGTTKKLAQNLANVCNGKLFEIVPTQLYTDDDLNWMNPKSRTSVEMKDINSRPQIKSKIDVSEYDIVFVGFPIWWYREPSIIDTFVEEYDFAGKTIIPFATSGGSGLGDSAQNIQRLAPQTKVLNGKKLSPFTTEKELQDWIGTILN